MRARRTSFCCVFYLICTMLVFGQSNASPSPVRDSQAVRVLEQSFALVSSVPVAEFRDSIVQARVRGRDDSTFKAITIKTFGRNVRTEAGTRTSIVARGRASEQTNGLWFSPHDPNAANRHADHLPAALLAELLLRNDMSVAYLGVAQKEGISAHHVRAVPVHAFPAETDPAFIEQLRKNETLDVYIDTQSGLLASISFVHVSLTDWRRGATVEIHYSDYRTFGGMKAPAKQRRTFNGQLAWDLELESVATNVGLSASDFTGRQ